MSKKVLVLAVHGMGDTQSDFAVPLMEKLKRQMGAGWAQVQFGSIYYQPLLQENQKRVWKRMLEEHDLDYRNLRKFMLFGFSDAGTLEHFSNDARGAAYLAVHQLIRQRLKEELGKLKNSSIPVVVLAQSLGCQVISNYVWDAQKGQNFWELDMGGENPDAGRPIEQVTDPTQRFLRLGTLRLFATSGCNMPMFLAGLNKPTAFAKPNAKFRWLNFFDQDDVLGWPLRPLSSSFEERVTEDIEMNAGNVLMAWTPFSHNGYWTDGDYVKRIAKELERLL